MEQSLAGARPAANVAISLDHYRDAVTDASGRYELRGVPEGTHEVGLDMEQLAADYEPGPAAKARVSVEPRAIARADFSVLRLTSLSGTVVAPKGARVENVVIRLAGTNRYTTPDPDGSFGFYNLREGQYEVVIDEQTLPEGYLLASPARVRVLASTTNPAAPIRFELKLKPPKEKPVREMLKEHLNLGGAGGANHNGAGGAKHNGAKGANHNGSGGAKHNGSGSVKRNGSGGANHNGSASPNRSGAGGANQNRSSDAKLNGSDSAKHNGSGSAKHNGSGSANHNGAGSAKHNGAGGANHNGSGSAKDNGSGRGSRSGEDSLQSAMRKPGSCNSFVAQVLDFWLGGVRHYLLF
jgi:hypothetical protein